MNHLGLRFFRSSAVLPGVIILIGLTCGALSLAVFGPSDPPSPESDAWYVKGSQLASTSQLDEAVEAFQAAQRADPKKADTYFALGTIWLQKRDWRRAETSFASFVKLRPKSAQGWVLLARSRLELGNTSSAMLAYRKALSLDGSAQEAKDALHRFARQ
ncbi:MAG TPA: tetratricopeptide repeat protein [Bryobacteraceae bacterium]|nr:tetratricopeptide repeat protein [Bryobacteraceae bacterium]